MQVIDIAKSPGKTDKIELRSFYPLLACLVENSHVDKAKPRHPALAHQIVNTPTPDAEPVNFGPDLGGWCSTSVILGQPITIGAEGLGEEWWPTAPNPNTLHKLARRIIREGFVLPILTAICVSILSEVYTTTSRRGTTERRTRLRYGTSPIADFGIVAGSLKIRTSHDKLGYLSLSDGSLIRGQDPEQHYWIYFTTVRGEDIILDCAAYTFNMGLCFNGVSSYIPSLGTTSSHAPAYFLGRTPGGAKPDLHIERKRASVLRNEALHRAMAGMKKTIDHTNMHAFFDFMDGLSGSSCSLKERDFLKTLCLINCAIMEKTVTDRRWTQFPARATMQIEKENPGGTGNLNDDSADAWFKYMTKWHRLKKAGKVGDESLAEAFQKWQHRWDARQSSSRRRR